MGKSRFGWLRRLLSSLRFRLSAAFAVLLAAVLVIINYYPVQLMREQVIATKETELWSAATTLAAALESYPELTEDNVYNAVRLLDVMRERRILAADAGGIPAEHPDGRHLEQRRRHRRPQPRERLDLPGHGENGLHHPHRQEKAQDAGRRRQQQRQRPLPLPEQNTEKGRQRRQGGHPRHGLHQN